jgi:phosphatidylinositol-3-phosphatase
VRRTVQLASAALGLVAAVGAVPASAHSGHPHAAVFAGTAGPSLGIGHVFVIVLENKSFAELYGDGTTANPGSPYVTGSLLPQGTLLPNYYGIGHLSNPNYVALISGQGPNPQNQADCQSYDDFLPSPAVLDPTNGQAVGQGCVFPRNVPTLPNQLDAAHLTWRGYMEDMGDELGREPAHCGEPAFLTQSQGPRDVTQTAAADDQYAARHNPFVYFHSIVDTGECHENVLPLGDTDATAMGAVLSKDLQTVSTTPNFSFITPDLCHDGHDATCADPKEPGGIAGIDEFLGTWVPLIEASPAFQQDGLLVITTDESEWNQSEQDSSSCCGEQPGPDTPMPGITGIGGGRTGSFVIGRCVAPGVTDPTAYNHYSLLRSFEDLFGVSSGGADGHGHLGYAAGTTSFGPDVFSSCPAPVAVLAKKG